MDDYSDIGSKARFEVGHIECTDRKALVIYSQIRTLEDHIRHLEQLRDGIDDARSQKGLALYVSQAERRAQRNTRHLQTEIKRKSQVLDPAIAKMVALESMSWDAIRRDATQFWSSFGSLMRLGRSMADIELTAAVHSAKLLAGSTARLLELILSGLTGYYQDQNGEWKSERQKLLLQANESLDRELTPVELYPGEIFWHIE